ncbi:hypothetical protein ABZ826_35280 [Streptomyces sp. NPDC047515]|uniref:hypothetical protein n=1 Tax=Streptomyces sp. NPDC047515 TaxID=3155380 RepID=UPI0033E83862
MTEDVNSRCTSGVASLTGQLNSNALLLESPTDERAASLSFVLVRPLPKGFRDQWPACLEPVAISGIRRGASHSVQSVLWCSRRPVHPQRLAEAPPLS